MSGKAAKDLFVEAVEMVGAERGVFLERECAGDVVLRDRVERLLAAHEGGGEFMGRPSGGGAGAAGHSTVAAKLREGPGTKIGAYKLLQQIGEGGFGVVFMAEQEQPVRRRVALKIIKLGMDTRAVIARFEAERQALAMMDHPNIARVFDAGSTDTGRPYFVMELVKGVPITEYADTNNLSTRERLELFVPVCRAVQHAHQKGIIHRDIKPANVLVTLHDGEPVAKVIDFGIAKATDHRLTEKTVFTEFRQLIGTPEYMSPEQAEMSGLDVDTRSDVYSLGVLLYELLTGTTPFDSREMREKAYDQIQKMIREVDPPRPSVRISTLGETLTAVASHRKVEAGKLSRLVKGDLDWIVMRCLEKDRTRRYDTASDLAADVGRHLGGEAVEAAPPGVGYRVRKFVRRNRGAATAVAIILGVFVLGTTGTAVGFVRANSRAESERKAKLRAQVAESSARDAAAAEKLAKEAADRDRDAAAFEAYVANIGAADASLAAHDVSSARLRLEACPMQLRNWEWNWLHAGCDRSVATFTTGKPEGFPRAKFVANGSRVLVVTRDYKPGDGTVTLAALYDADTGNVLCSFDKQAGILTMDSSPDGSRLLIVYRDNKVSAMDTTGQHIADLFPGNHATPMSSGLSPDGRYVVTGAEGNGHRICNLDERTEIPIALGDEGLISSVHFSRNARRFIVIFKDRSATIWDTASRREIGHLVGHRRPITAVAFSPDERFVATASEDHTARLYDAGTGSLVRVLRGHERGVESLEFSPDGSRLVTASMDNTARVWNGTDGSLLGELHGHSHWISTASFSPDGMRIATASPYDGTIRIWDAVTCRELTSLRTKCWSASYNPSGSQLLTVDFDSIARTWDALSEPDDQMLRWPTTRYYLSGHSRDGKLATYNRPGVAGRHDIEVIEEESGRVVSVLSGHEGEIHSTAFSSDATTVVTNSLDDRTARVWDVQTGNPRAVLRHAQGVYDAQFSPDGTIVVTSSSDHALRLWEVASEKQVGMIDTLRSINVQNGAEVVKLESPEHIAVSPNGLLLAASEQSGRVGVWELRTQRQVSALCRHSMYDVQSIAFSPDSTRLLSTGNRAARLWDPLAGKEVLLMRIDQEALWGTFSADGNQILVGVPEISDAIVFESQPYHQRYKTIQARRAARAAVSRTLDARAKSDPNYLAATDWLTADRSLTAEQRDMAKSIIYQRSEQAAAIFDKLCRFAWTVALDVEADDSIRQGALDSARRAVALRPDDASFRALGATLYRAGIYEPALEALKKVSAIKAGLQESGDPETVAFVAMCQFRLGETARARESLAVARGLGKLDNSDQDFERQDLLAEAERLIGTSVEPSPNK